MTVQMLKMSNAVAEMLNPTYDLSAALTPDALMTYCSTRLRGIDEQVNVAFHKQQVANRDSGRLSELTSSFMTANGQLDLNNTGTMQDVLNQADKMLKTAAAVEDPVVKQKLVDGANALIKVVQNAADDRMGGASYDIATAMKDRDIATIGSQLEATIQNGANKKTECTLDASQLKAMTTDLVGGIQKDLNAGTELSMINLQSLMSQRQSAVQLITNMVQSLGDQVNKIAANIGH